MDRSITDRACGRIVEHCGFFCESPVVRCLARRIARIAAWILACAVCDSNSGSTDSQAIMELADATDDGLFCRHGLVVHVGSRPRASSQCHLVAILVSRVGDAGQRADFW